MTVQVTIEPWGKIDFQELAHVAYAVRKASNRDDVAIDRIQAWLSRLEFDVPPVFILARTSDELAGWLLVFIQNPTTIEINPWFLGGHPFAFQEKNGKEIATELLIKATEFARNEGFTRIGLLFYRDHPWNNQFRALYESIGMKLADETVVMRRKLSSADHFDIKFPSEFKIKPLREIDQEELYKIWYEIFKTGQNRFFTGRTKEQRREFFNECFDPAASIIEEGSLAIVRADNSGEICGFSFSRPTHGEGNSHLGEFGISPQFRGKGLGKNFLRLIISQLAQLDLKTMSLGVDPENHAAYQLYQSQGFVEEFGIVEYALQLESQKNGE
ncbi:MAG: GNAT family N-acetyltransferase [Candidatus Hodarchaeales archaeon]|jgi:ribosomal protein S18 acetylase RimI-like enzyme